MKNYKFIVQYDGTAYAGWQSQLNAPSVQSTLEDVIKTLTQEKVSVIGSGRTDSGVHALGQTANFRIEKELDLYKFKYSLNQVLPKDIAVPEIMEADFKFHSRFDARKRSYLYFFSRRKSPFWYRYSSFLNRDAKVEVLNRLSEPFLGEKNFNSFSRKITDTENKVCNIFDLHWRETKDFVIFYIQASRFLHGMVRTIAGTIVRTALEKGTTADIENIIANQDRETAGEAVPAKGLFLYKVNY